MAITTATKKIIKALEEPTFFKVLQGGMGASKTFSTLLILKEYAKQFRDSVITVVGISYPHLRDGAIRDFMRIMRETGEWRQDWWSEVRHQYRFPNKSSIEFTSIDKLTAHGLRRDVLFVNEAYGMDFDTFDQMASRTRIFSIIDFNPVAEFWAQTELTRGRFKNDTSTVVLTYKDNEALTPREVENIERHRPAEGEPMTNWWRVYGLGQVGSLEGNIYSGWEEATNDVGAKQLVRYGLDFGFSNDETAMVAVYETEVSNTIYVKEVLYKKGMLGSQYVETLQELGIDPSVLIVADSARPEIIAEIKKGGFRCVGADKNPGSVKRGIDRVKQRRIIYEGLHLRKEYLAYSWRKTRGERVLDEPQDGNDHLMDALRYAIDDMSRSRWGFG